LHSTRQEEGESAHQAERSPAYPTRQKCKPAVAYLSQEPISEGPYVIDCGGIGYCTVLEFRVVKLGTVVKCGKCEDTDKVMRFTTERWGRSVMAPGKQ
jgi:hypothetical protein